MSSKVQNVTTLYQFFVEIDPSHSTYDTLHSPANTNIDVQYFFALSPTGLKQYTFIDYVGITNVINIPTIHVQPNQEPLLLVVSGEK